MRPLKAYLFITFIAAAAITQQSCKAKKLAAQPAAPVTAMPQSAPVKQEPVVARAKPVDQAMSVAPTVEKANYNFKNVQFEFNSGVLKTDAYPILDNAVTEMKKDPSAKFILKGYASIEGTPQHNMELSVDRANAVKSYLVNSGVSIQNITAQGFGTANPIADNNSENGKVVNRRVEIRLQK